MRAESELRAAICQWGKSLFDRGLTSGSSGNISVRLTGGFLVTPTNSCLGFLDPHRLSRLDAEGHHIDGDKPSKEVPMHLAMYGARPSAGAVVHLHSTYATAWSCRSDIDPANCLPPLTPYVLMRAGRLPLLPYFDPGSTEIVGDLSRAAVSASAVLLANHGPVISADTLESAVFAAEEVEEAARVAFILEGKPMNHLDATTIARLLRRDRS